jgi:saccharopine dehydrogenase-like NADP-dependent oxidoreductase
MKQILVVGAGRSSYALIQYLLFHAAQEKWHIVVADADLRAAQGKITRPDGQPHPLAGAALFNGEDTEACDSLVMTADLVVSLLPAHLHLNVAKACLKFARPLVTASYAAPEMRQLDAEAKARGVLLLNECGLDPGIDHASAMQTIHQLKAEGANLLAFRSYTGGLLAPESDNNPWHYKFTWNPRNVVMAGRGMAKYIINGQYKYVPYHRLFSHLETIKVDGYGEFEGYPNRDSLQYRDQYGLAQLPTMIRGTLRRPGFCQAWNAFVQLGMTDDSFVIENSVNLTYREFTNSFLQYSRVFLVEEKLAQIMNVKPDSELIGRLRWLGLFDHAKIGLHRATPADILLKILQDKWALAPDDRDMIVMQHQFEYTTSQGRQLLTSSLVVQGDNPHNTAMAKTVGLPLGIAARLILNGKLALAGVQIPILPEIYTPLLNELTEWGIRFTDEVTSLEE